MHNDKKVAIILWLIGFAALLPAAFFKIPIFFAVLGAGSILTGSWKFGRRVIIEHRESKISGWDNPDKSRMAKYIDDR